MASVIVLQLAVAAALALPPEAPVRVACPLRAVTRVVLPEPLSQLKTTRAARRALGVTVERTRPEGVLRVEPRGRSGTALVELHGPTLHVRLALETVAEGADGEVRLARDGKAEGLGVAERPSPDVAAGAPVDATAAASTPSPAPLPPEPSPAPLAPPREAGPSAAAPPSPTPGPAVSFDLSNLMRATPVPIGRREGLPGQKPMTLVDALRGETHLWLRFTLEDGAASRVRSVSWESGRIETFTQEAVGRDLRVVVQLPSASVTRKTRVVLVMESGAEYRFALSSGTLAGLWRRIFN